MYNMTESLPHRSQGDALDEGVPFVDTQSGVNVSLFFVDPGYFRRSREVHKTSTSHTCYPPVVPNARVGLLMKIGCKRIENGSIPAQ